MAAGAGRRFGFKPKALLQRDGESLLARQIRLLDEAGVRQVAVVLGHHAERLSPVVQRIAAARPHLDVRVALNPSPDDGQGSSLRCGLRALPAADDSAGSADAPGYLVLLADQPLLEVGDVSAMLRAWRDRAANIDLVLPTHQGQPGHPLVFGASVRQAILQGQGGEGVREWRRAHPERVSLIPMGHARGVTDVDTPDDLQTLADQHGVRLRWPDEADGTD